MSNKILACTEALNRSSQWISHSRHFSILLSESWARCQHFEQNWTIAWTWSRRDTRGRTEWRPGQFIFTVVIGGHHALMVVVGFTCVWQGESRSDDTKSCLELLRKRTIMMLLMAGINVYATNGIFGLNLGSIKHSLIDWSTWCRLNMSMTIALVSPKLKQIVHVLTYFNNSVLFYVWSRMPVFII